MKGIRRIGLELAAIGLTVAACAGTAIADGAPAPTRSWYVRSTDPAVLAQAGCATGETVRNAPGQPAAVVLVFGGLAPNDAGDWTFDLYREDTTAPSAVSAAVLTYVDAYERCAAGSPGDLTVVVGTTTSGGRITREAGAAFARVVDDVARAASGRRVTILGGNDIELGYIGPTVARSWVDGYHDATERLLVNYGDLAGCPGDRVPHGGDCGTPEHPEWTVEDVWHVTGHPRTVNFPTIYVTTGVQARQWRNLSRYGLARHGRPLRFLGTLSQIAACQARPCSRFTRNTPAAAWHQLRTLLVAEPRLGAADLAASDIGWMDLPPGAVPGARWAGTIDPTQDFASGHVRE